MFCFAEGAVGLGAAVGEEFFATRDGESCLGDGSNQVGERPVVEMRLFAAGFSWVSGDGDGLRGCIAIEAAVLDFMVGVPAPVGFLGDAEAWVHQYAEAAALRGEGFGDIGEQG